MLSSVRPSTFQNLAKQNKFQAKNCSLHGETVGLAKLIIDDTILFFLFLVNSGDLGIENCLIMYKQNCLARSTSFP